MPGGGGGVGQDYVKPDFADSALLLPLNLYGKKRRPFCRANGTCQALLLATNVFWRRFLELQSVHRI